MESMWPKEHRVAMIGIGTVTQYTAPGMKMALTVTLRPQNHIQYALGQSLWHAVEHVFCMASKQLQFLVVTVSDL